MPATFNDDDELMQSLSNTSLDPSRDGYSVFLRKGHERYLFRWVDGAAADTLRMMGRHASNPELSFSWYDAAVLSQKVRKYEREAAEAAKTTNRLPKQPPDPAPAGEHRKEMEAMRCPVPCDVCGEIIELDAAHFQTAFCSCRGDQSCTHGVCEECLAEYGEDEEP